MGWAGVRKTARATQALECEEQQYKMGWGGRDRPHAGTSKGCSSYLITFIYFNATIFVIIHLLVDHAESFQAEPILLSEARWAEGAAGI